MSGCPSTKGPPDYTQGHKTDEALTTKLVNKFNYIGRYIDGKERNIVKQNAEYHAEGDYGNTKFR
jgi:hypothetical protein